MVAAGDRYALAVKADGGVAGWGEDRYGELGQGVPFHTTAFQSLRVPENFGEIAEIVSGGDFNLVRDTQGRIWSWGENSSRQLGDCGGSGVHSRARILEVGDCLPDDQRLVEPVVGLAGGGTHALALTRDGSVWSWGGNEEGQLGFDTPIDPLLGVHGSQGFPRRIEGLPEITAVAAGLTHSVALSAEGAVWTWGRGYRFRSSTHCVRWDYCPAPTAVRVPGQLSTEENPLRVTAVAAGAYFSLALREDGTVWSWGENSVGQLGNGFTYDSTVPVQVVFPEGTVITAIQARRGHALAIDSQGQGWAWGLNTDGQLGDGTTQTQHRPVSIAVLADLRQIRAGAWHSLAYDGNGRLWVWGRNSEGQLGNDSTESQMLPRAIDTPSPVMHVAAGRRHSLVVAEDGWLGATGLYRSAGLNAASRKETYTVAQAVTSLSNVVSVSAGKDHALALDGNGAVWAWGWNGSGALGNGTGQHSATPTMVSGLADTVAIAAGANHSLGIKRDGTLWAWGRNAYGQLGVGDVSDRNSPQIVDGLSDIVAVAAGDEHSVAVTAEGNVWAWGHNGYGELGYGDQYHRSTPVPVTGLSGIIAVAAGEHHTLALDADGSVWAWGKGVFGQLGDGGNQTRLVPVRLDIGEGVIIREISARGNRSAALERNGRVWYWGIVPGQAEVANEPRELPSWTRTASPVTSFAQGDGFLALRRADGAIFTWGEGESGQLGNGSLGATDYTRRTRVVTASLEDYLDVDASTPDDEGELPPLRIALDRRGSLADLHLAIQIRYVDGTDGPVRALRENPINTYLTAIPYGTADVFDCSATDGWRYLERALDRMDSYVSGESRLREFLVGVQDSGLSTSETLANELDLRGLPLVDIYVGYGRSSAEMLQAHQGGERRLYWGGTY